MGEALGDQMYCTQCGNQLDNDANFCGNCGAIRSNKKQEKAVPSKETSKLKATNSVQNEVSPEAQSTNNNQAGTPANVEENQKNSSTKQSIQISNTTRILRILAFVVVSIPAVLGYEVSKEFIPPSVVTGFFRALALFGYFYYAWKMVFPSQSNSRQK